MTPGEIRIQEAEKAVRAVEIKRELSALDKKRTRPLAEKAEGDAAYLAVLNARAIALRAELKALE